MNLDDEIGGLLGAGDSTSPGNFADVRARAARIRRRRRLAASSGFLVVLAVTGGIVATTAREPDRVSVRSSSETAATDEPVTLPTVPSSSSVIETPTSAPITTTTTVEPSTTTQPLSPNDVAVRTFVDAWNAGDTDRMRSVASDEAVETALYFQNPSSPFDCRSQPSGQYQCLVEVSDGQTLYLLVGPPGGVEGRVWFVGPYHQD